MKKNNYFQLVYLILPLYCFWGFVVYQFYSLNTLGIIITSVLALFSGFVYIFLFNSENEVNFFSDYRFQLFYLLFFVLGATSLIILIKNSTAQSIVSPWEIVPTYFFVFYILAILALIYILGCYQNNFFTCLTLIFYFFLSFSIAALVFRIGYGFDPFVHEAAMSYINKFGAINPKTLYYIGEYAPLIFLHKFLSLSFSNLNSFFLPFIASISLVLIFWSMGREWLKDKYSLLILTIATIMFPTTIFINTVPQNLAYLFLIIVIFFGLMPLTTSRKVLMLVFSLAAFTVHPIAGLPAIFFSALCLLDYNQKTTRWLYFLTLGLNIFTLPFLFYLEETNFSLVWPNFVWPSLPSFALFDFSVPGREKFYLNFVELWAKNWQFVFLILILLGIYLWKKNKNLGPNLKKNLAMSMTTLISFFITIFLPFSYLIDYERQDYSERLLIVAAIFAWPFLILSIKEIIGAVVKENFFVRSTFLIFLALIIGTSSYLTYPRYDRYEMGRGHSTSIDDLRAVQWIEQDAKGKDYLVLANQQVSAAALKEYGFKKYYGSFFYYPIPTSAPTYELYLDMTKAPEKEIMNKAMDLAGVRLSYFVFNKYWWDFAKIKEEAKLASGSYRVFGNDEVIVYKFEH